MKRSTTFWLLGIVAIVLVVSLLFFGHGTTDGGCPNTGGQGYTVTIQGDKVSDPDIHAQLCSRLTIVNKDDVTREIAFGAHDNHVPYDGIAERILDQNQQFTITFDQAGRFHWHDHEHDTVQGYFTVTK